ncbi:MAG: transposase [Elusimicrobia bacterium]|nr:transposase [Elusimicrobiota bacterium]
MCYPEPNMGRPKRIQFPGACYYVILQGNNRQDIFLSNQDRRYFLNLLRSYKERRSLKVYAFCLMASEVHLLIETQHANLSTVMQGFNTGYTKYFNSQHDSMGHVFQGRYRALLVDKDKFLAETTRYVHLRPVRAGLKEKPWRYVWSSCAAYVEAHNPDHLVDSEAVLKPLAKTRLAQSVRYLTYIKERLKNAHQFELPVQDGVIGGEEYLAKLANIEPVSPALARPIVVQDAKRILSEMAVKHGIEEERLVGRLQWREITAVRRQAIYRIWKETRIGVTELGRLFNRTPSAVSQLIRDMEAPTSR